MVQDLHALRGHGPYAQARARLCMWIMICAGAVRDPGVRWRRAAVAGWRGSVRVGFA